MNRDLIDDYLQKPKHKKKLFVVRMLPYIMPVLFILGVIILLFIFTPKDAWVTYKTTANNISFNKVMLGTNLKVTTDSLHIISGKMTNNSSLSVKVEGKVQTLAPRELRIVFDKASTSDVIDISPPNVLLDKNVLIESKGANELDSLEITNNYYKDAEFKPEFSFLNGFRVNVGTGKSFELIRKQNVESYSKRSKTVWSVSSDREISFNFKGNVEIYLKNKKITFDQLLELIPVESNSTKSSKYLELEFLTDEAFILKVLPEKSQTINYYGYSSDIKIVGNDDAVLTVIKSGEPQKYEVPGAIISAHAKDFPYNQITSYLTVDKKSKEGGPFKASGTVNKLSINNNSLFQNPTQWAQNNISTIITTILTAIITALVAYLTTSKTINQRNN
ncbi:hypothetical protein M3661_19870 [Paenibacillus sp. MER 180]|uniref:hypothetical protein n=1 Tax=Paenibacillus sp. MER 180 TaxID=2939570 RepID=UPI00204111EC|nr:hypothetical protein [Paenibacillus sp. MER 180]MCM3292382.1 hypothetical protein [Paenibacillus sp. MER 180]